MLAGAPEAAPAPRLRRVRNVLRWTAAVLVFAAVAGGILRNHGLRHIAADAWRTRDGMRTEVYLLHFDSRDIADYYYYNNVSEKLPIGFETATLDYETPKEFQRPAFATLRGRMSENPDAEGRFGRVAVIKSGDVVAVVLTRSPAGVSRVPFDQAVALQTQLLG